MNILPLYGVTLTSPSSRRAWIEIEDFHLDAVCFCVALLAEGVDRNKEINALFNNIRVALLAEGVDRNSHVTFCFYGMEIVALLAEGVDRNLWLP